MILKKIVYIAVGFALGFMSVLTIFVLNDLSVFVVFKTLSEWQTLIAGALALMGAFITVRAILAQTESARKNLEYQLQQEKEAREFDLVRKSIAYRAALPHAVSSLHSYALQTVKMHLEIYQNAQKGEGKKALLSPKPEISDQAILVFRENIQHCKNISDAHFLRNILMLLQISHSRMQSLEENLKNTSRRSSRSFEIDNILYSLKIFFLINMCFEFARSEMKTIERKNISAGDIAIIIDNRSGFFSLEGKEEIYEQFERYLNNNPNWLFKELDKET